MNDTYINYIDQLLDLAERDDIFCMTSRAFNEFAVEVREVLEKQKPVKPIYYHRYADMWCAVCKTSVGGWEKLPHYCPQCGQAIDWSEE